MSTINETAELRRLYACALALEAEKAEGEGRVLDANELFAEAADHWETSVFLSRREMLRGSAEQAESIADALWEEETDIGLGLLADDFGGAL